MVWNPGAHFVLDASMVLDTLSRCSFVDLLVASTEHQRVVYLQSLLLSQILYIIQIYCMIRYCTKMLDVCVKTFDYTLSHLSQCMSWRRRLRNCSTTVCPRVHTFRPPSHCGCKAKQGQRRYNRARVQSILHPHFLDVLAL